MADLQAMFQNLGPTSASLMNGIQMGQQYNANESEQAMRQAQMNKILEETNQAKLMNPLELQAKQQTIASNALKAKADEGDYHAKALGDMIPRLESVPEAARHSAIIDMATKAGIPMEQADVAHLQTMKANEIVPYLKRVQEHTITQNEKYRQAMDTALIQERSHKYSADSSASAQRYAADQRAQLAKDRAAASASDTAMLAKMGNNYAGQQAYYERKARDAYNAGNDTDYNYYVSLRDKAAQMDKEVRAAPTDAKTAAEQARLQSLQGGGSVIVKPPVATTGQTKSGAKYTIETTP